MITFRLSAFSDEYSPKIDDQIDFLVKHDISYMEIRGVDDSSVADISLEKAKEVKNKIDANGIKISAVGSPSGKIGINEEFEPHLDQFKHLLELANVLDASKMRIFSFFMPENEKPENYRNAVIEKLGIFEEEAKKHKVMLCHENEKNIYGDTPERCRDIFDSFKGNIKCVFDHANFISCGVEPYPFAFDILKDTLSHMHIKDANKEAEMVPSGEGIGRIPETIKELKSLYDGEFILTLEPHLMTFDGLASLESEGHTSRLGNRYSGPLEAFEIALNSLKKYL